MTIKAEHQTTGNALYGQMSHPSCCSLHQEELCLHLKNNQGSLQSRMPGSNSKIRGRFFHGLCSNIVVQYSVGPIITLHGDAVF
jgi:hypothetical protein